MIGWEEQVRRRFTPHLFTGDAWATLSVAQRDQLRRQRMAVVQALSEAHERRYHSHAQLTALDLALHDHPDTELP